MAAELKYQALGVDSVEFACTDARYWSGVLERFGFAVEEARPGLAALVLGELKLQLSDPAHPDEGEAVRRFVGQHGEMQVRSAAIAVDDAERAHTELSSLAGCSAVE